MATYNPPYNPQGVGIPTQSEDTIGAAAAGLFSGLSPEVVTNDLIVAASQTIPALTPVGYDANKRLVPAVAGGATPIAPVGITVHAITTDASTTYKGVAVYRAGCFNPDMLNWPASFDTDAEKFAAFEGAPSPTQIVIRRPRAYAL